MAVVCGKMKMLLLALSMMVVLATATSRFPMTTPGWKLDPTETRTIPTSSGYLQGARYTRTTPSPTPSSEHAVWAFLGVPFAAPPVGALRWREPQAVDPTMAGETYDATMFGPSCVQFPSPEVPSSVMSEDCLYLNVYVPESVLDTAGGAPSPVMEYIYGGSFVSGSSSKQDINGLNLTSSSSAIVVTLNYRLGPFGFLASPPSLAVDGSTGNYGLLDQRAAMAWVESNIAAFGGDKDAITLFGESAGAISVCYHLVWHRNVEHSLFSRAILQSPDCDSGTPLQVALEQGKAFASATGCSTSHGDPNEQLECMRALSSHDVLTALPLAPFGDPNGASYGGVIDGDVVKAQPNAELASQGVEQDLPVVLGTCAESCTLFVMPNEVERNMNESTLHAMLGALWPPPIVAKILDTYPLSAYPLVPPASAWAHMLSDYVFHCPTRTTASVLADGNARAHLYVYDHTPTCDAFPQALHKYLGAYHYADVPATFGNPPLTPPEPCQWSPGDNVVSAQMQSLWTDFAFAKDPAPASVWPPYSTSSRPVLFISPSSRLSHNYEEVFCHLWDTIPPPGGYLSHAHARSTFRSS